MLARANAIAGFSFLQLAKLLQLAIPEVAEKRKGFIGCALEMALGVTAGNQPLPDFHHLGIELKTIPMGSNGKPRESTFITSIPLLTIHRQTWASSQCRQKLARILWVPVEGDPTIPFTQRRIGQATLWSMSAEEEAALKNDWQELTGMIAMGRLEEIDASLGEFLQVRPKALNARSLCYGFDAVGQKIKTLPRGFYLRSRFTERLL